MGVSVCVRMCVLHTFFTIIIAQRIGECHRDVLDMLRGCTIEERTDN